MMKKDLLIFGILILAVIGVIFISGCVQRPELQKLDCPFECCIDETYKSKACPAGYECQENICIELKEEQPSAVEFQFVRKIEVGAGGYPNIIFANNHFYMSYQMGDGRIIVKVYDKNFIATGEEHQLTGDEGWDHQMVFGNGYFYLVNPLFLRKFDSDWNDIGSVSITANLPPQMSIGDMLLRYVNDSLYLGNAVGNTQQDKGKKLDIPDNLYIRKYNQNLGLESEIMLKDVGNTPGSSIIFQNGIFTIVTSDRHWDDSSIIVVRYDANWNFIDNKTISAISGANEEFPMGVLFENGLYFVTYIYITGDLSQPVDKEPVRRVDVMLKVFDQDWNLLNQKIVTEELPASSVADHVRAPHLGLTGNKIYVAYGSTESGIPKVFVKEYEII